MNGGIMKKIFWEEVVEIREIAVYINKKDLKEKEKLVLLQEVYETFHMRVVDTVLNHLPHSKHPKFLDHLAKKPSSPKILQLLKEDVEDIEDKIKHTAKKFKKEILSLIDK
jgi:hypothetical protein